MRSSTAARRGRTIAPERSATSIRSPGTHGSRASPTRPEEAARPGARTGVRAGNRSTRDAIATTHGRSRPIPIDPELWYVSVSTGPFRGTRPGDPEAHIYRRVNGTWRALDRGLPDPLSAMPYALVALKGRLLAGLADGELWESRDRGETWSRCELRGDELTGLVALTAAWGGYIALATGAARTVERALRRRQRRRPAEPHRDDGDVVLGAEEHGLAAGRARLAAETAADRVAARSEAHPAELRELPGREVGRERRRERRRP